MSLQQHNRKDGDPLSLAEAAVADGRFPDAIQCYEEMLKPGAEATALLLHNLVPLYLKCRRPTRALECAQALVYFAPRSTDAWMALANLRERLADWEGALDCLHRVLELDPHHFGAHQSRLFILSARAPADQVRKIHSDWARTIPTSSYIGTIDNRTNRRLRIGYVSGDFRNHVMDRVLEPLLKYHNCAQFDVYAYSTTNRPDATTDRMRRNLCSWRDISSMDDAAASAQIRADAIDVLVDQSGLTFGQRFSLFAVRPAPLLVTSTGYLPTTGARFFDHKLCDDTCDQADYTEHLWKIPTALCPTPLPGAPPIKEPPALRNGYITFGVVNSWAKVTREAINAWVRILQRVPNARLVLVVAGASEPATAVSILRRFGPVQDRVLFTEWQTGANFPTVLNDIDIALNTHPYGGCMTSFDTLWQGTPIVCLDGDRAVGKYASKFMRALDQSSYIGKTWDDYVDIASIKAHRIPELVHLRNSMRNSITSNPMFNVESWVQSVEQAYKQMWKVRCESTIP